MIPSWLMKPPHLVFSHNIHYATILVVITSPALGALFPREPYIFHKRVASMLLDFTPPGIELLMLPRIVMAWAARLIDHAARLLVTFSAYEAHGTWKKSAFSSNRWGAFVGLALLPALEGQTRIAIEAPTGSGKTTGLVPALICKERVLVLLEPRKKLVRDNQTVRMPAISRGVPLPLTGACVMTYGHFRARFLEDRNGTVWKRMRIICDEYHEASVDIVDVLRQIPIEAQVVCMSATANKEMLDLAKIPPENRIPVNFVVQHNVRIRPMYGVSVVEAALTIINENDVYSTRLLIITPQLNECERIAEQLSAYGLYVTVLHGKSGETPKDGHLVATQVVDSGMNFPGTPITCVIDSCLQIHSSRRGI
eukprot:GHVR01026786.1.p2 GENE.GHVR01026786.1~~GHVR01026786.1.p2  ORF type:complete len:367 (+),score=7.73 GHVR01026786.1:1850-2950(+)